MDTSGYIWYNKDTALDCEWLKMKSCHVKILTVLLAFLIFVSLWTGAGDPPEFLPQTPVLEEASSSEKPVAQAPKENAQKSEPLPPPKAEQAAEPELPMHVTLLAAGDNLIHNTIIKWARTVDAYDFSPAYESIKGLVQSADMAFINQETPMAGDSIAFSGFPRFNSPSNVAYAVRAAGFDIVNFANNHVLDKNEAGLLATLELLNRLELTVIGANRSEEERSRIRITEAGGVRFAWLSYTYGTNGIPVKHRWMVNLIDREVIEADVLAAKSQADAVIVSMHWGNEYKTRPSAQQKDLAKFLADLGVTLVIGHHPHVLEPVEWISGASGGETLVAYSLGNLISSQSRADTMLGGLLRVDFEITGGNVSISKADVVPVVTHFERGYRNFRIYPLWEYTPELAARHSLNSSGQRITSEYFSCLAEEILGEFSGAS